MARPKKQSVPPIDSAIESVAPLSTSIPSLGASVVAPIVAPVAAQPELQPPKPQVKEDEKIAGFRKIAEKRFVDYETAKSALEDSKATHAQLIKGGQVKLRIRYRPSNAYDLCTYSFQGKQVL